MKLLVLEGEQGWHRLRRRTEIESWFKLFQRFEVEHEWTINYKSR